MVHVDEEDTQILDLLLSLHITYIYTHGSDQDARSDRLLNAKGLYESIECSQQVMLGC